MKNLTTLKLPYGTTSVRAWFTIQHSDFLHKKEGASFGYTGHNLEEIVEREFGKNIQIEYIVDEIGWNIILFNSDDESIATVDSIMYQDSSGTERYLNVAVEDITEDTEDDDVVYTTIYNLEDVDTDEVIDTSIYGAPDSKYGEYIEDQNEVCFSLEAGRFYGIRLEATDEEYGQSEKWIEEARLYIENAINKRLPDGMYVQGMKNSTWNWIYYTFGKYEQLTKFDVGMLFADAKFAALTLDGVKNGIRDVIDNNLYGRQEPEPTYEEVMEKAYDEWASTQLMTPFKKNPELFFREDGVDYYFLCPETITFPGHDQELPNNWLFSPNYYEWEHAIRTFSKDVPSEEEFSAEWLSEVQDFIFGSINELLPKGFEILQGGYIAHVNPEGVELSTNGVIALADCVQWQLLNLTPTMDYSADIIRNIHAR